MTGQQLKNSILQMAVQGKLVPQDPNDEPASVLLERIRKEKEQLIKEGKIKKEKNPSYIFRCADNLPYEKVGKNEPVCIADEVPFEIPESWEWVRLGTVIELQSGQDMTPDKYNDCGKGIPYITGASNIENGNVLINRWTEYGRAFAYCGDILLTCKGTVGTMAVLQKPQVHIARQIMAIRPISELYVPYIQLVLETLVEDLKAAAKSMIPGIAREDVLQSLFPVPPVSEQKRIVQKVSELSPCLEQYAAADTKLLSLNTAFPETLKKSILQEAVQGKLVPQDPSDEPASVLLERIRTEKEQLIKAGKIKRDKHESIIFRRDNSHYEKLDGIERCIDDEIPFDLPESWEWVRFFSVVDIATNLVRPEEYADYMHIAPDNIEKATGTLFECHTVRQDKVVSPNHLFYKGQIIYSKIRPLLRKAIIAPFDGLCSADMYPLNTAINRKYLLRYMLSDAFNLQVATAMSSRVKMPKINQDELSKILIPIPPMQEQERIVSKIEELFDKITLI